MQRMKKSFIWMVLMALVVSVMPQSIASVAYADTLPDAPTSYFTPDISGIRNTVALKQEETNSSSPDFISREKLYQVQDSQLAVTGTYTKVTGSTLGVNVQQLNWDNGKWVSSPTHVTPGVVTLDVERPDNRFKANLTLYQGVNKITFTGSQGFNERSESFYVLFDTVPYVEKLTVHGGSDKLNLNEGAQIVVPVQQITIEGKAQNATKVTIAANGGSALATTLLQDGTFFTPQLQLKPGINDLKLVVQNSSDSLTFNYQLYYYDEKSPIVSMYLADSADNGQSLLNQVPVFTENKDSGRLYVQLLVPDSGSPFEGSANVQMNSNPAPGLQYYKDIKLDGAKINKTPGQEIFIPSVSQNTPSYRLVTFSVDPLTFNKEANGDISLNQTHNMSITYGTKTISKKIEFQYMQGKTVITDLKYLTGYTGTGDVPAGEPLNGAKVNASDFYILVSTNSTPSDPAKLQAQYLPLGTKSIAISYVSKVSDTQYIYKVSDFQNGNQTVRFNFEGSSAYKDAVISFASKSYIYVSNLTDGQSYKMDSSGTNRFPVKGQYIDFDLKSPYFTASLYVNGTKITTDNSWLDGQGNFNQELVVDAKQGPLVYGENRIVLLGTTKDDKGQTREIKKELRIYILDQNVSTVVKFQPALGKDRPAFPARDFDDKNEQLAKIFNLTPDFVYKDTQFKTSLKTYDIVLRGSGAVKANLNLGTKNILSVDIPVNNMSNETVTFADQRYTYEFAGSRNDFVMRIQDLTANMPGTYVYTLELINETGAKTSQKLELVREESPYRIISPQPTVGGKYVVTKNFLHFDIEAEGADSVKIDKEEAKKRTDLGEHRFVLDYVGLKQDKSNKIKITITRGKVTNTDTIEVYYSGIVDVDAEYMAPKVANKYTVFNKAVQLSFPKGTVMQSTDIRGLKKYYPETKLLFGIADPVNGIVERRNDYGNIIGFPGTGEDSGQPTWSIPDEYMLRFGSTGNTNNFVRVSNVYWISGGMGETTTPYSPATNGLPPYSVSGLFGDPTIPAERKVTPSQRGTLTLSYNPSVVDEAGYTITVFRYNAKREWENIGGEADAKNHTITVPFDQFGYYTVMKMSRGYSDVTNHAWARNILNALYSKGFMNNLRFEQFGADDQTTRGEFATLLVKGLNLPLNYDDKNTFVDLVPTARSATWDYEHIETAARAGIVTGLTDGVFAPDQPLTREQAAVMIARALKLKLAPTDQKLKDALAKSFLDSGKIDVYALSSIQAVTKAKIMAGSPVTQPGQKKPQYNFNPKANMTRAEAGKIAVELLKKGTKVFPKNLS
ncbi:S-layer homology domain-containing protein [Paenibacillus donghaensis]|uniref:S-layer homology domain-containing protein n=1 Tax=Paenibacillus donghaensis TaxID=414771 RepID=UPI001883D5C0|nr:S-layer homology domain-containing protein [Paenibacillus donghaensis]MBE9916776.1 S-layer homology domain-containing protein [Paenibacillus donghaensis]